jgi:hypothetical protein
MDETVREFRKHTGHQNYIHACDNNNHVKSRSHHFKQDKARNWRRRADRASHHRRRQIMKSALQRGIEDYVLPPTAFGSTQTYKKVIGAREHFAFSTPKAQGFRAFGYGGNWSYDTKTVGQEIPIVNNWHTVLHS